MPTVKFEERAVAFIDVLGFKGIVAKAVDDPIAMKQLQGLVDLLSSAVPTFDKIVSPSAPRHLIPMHNYISDSVILSAPISDSSMKSYKGLEILVMRVIQLTHHFLNKGYLIRGGISVGKAWHKDTNIVGPAYQEAYLLESTGDNPCVVLSSEAERTWLQDGGGASRMCIRKPPLKYRICKKSYAPLMVNGLHDYYIPQNTQHGSIEQRYNHYADIVNDNLGSVLPKSAKRKWRWFGGYLKAESSEAAQWAVA